MIQLNQAVTAAKVLRSWARAVEIPLEHPLAVDGLRLAVLTAQDAVPDGVLCLAAAALASANLPLAVDCFHVLTTRVGRGRPMPVDRGVGPTRSEIYGQDPFLTLARHREFRQAPDLPPKRLAFYGPLVKRWARGFASVNRRLCAAHGFEVEDLETFGMIWAHIFAHKGEIPGMDEDNRKLFLAYLRQRGASLFRSLVHRGRDTYPDAPEAHMALTGEVLDKTPVNDPWNQEISTGVVMERPQAQALLDKRLAELPHDKMVKALQEASKNPNRDYITQQRAARMLKDHEKSCPSCHEGADRGQEDPARVHPGGTPEPLQNPVGGHRPQVLLIRRRSESVNPQP